MSNLRDIYTRRFIALFIPLAALFLGVVWYVYDVTVGNRQAIVEASEVGTVTLQERTAEIDLNGIVSDLRILADQVETSGFLSQRDSSSLRGIEALFLEFARHKQRYDQLRILDSGGMEIVRINDSDGHPTVVPPEQLQSKANRYYFTESLHRGRGQIYISPLDLNIENNIIEQPLKPMLRFGTPLFDTAGQPQGVLVLNYLARGLINHLKQVNQGQLGEFLLLNEQGYWLVAVDPAQEWSFMYPERQALSFAKMFPTAWQRIATSISGQFSSPQGLFTFTTVFPDIISQSQVVSNTVANDIARRYHWKIVTRVAPAVLRERIQPAPRAMLITVTGGLGLLVWVSWLITRTYGRLLQTIALLRASEARFRALSTMAADWFWEQDAQFRFTYFSNSFDVSAALLGRCRWELPTNLTPTQWAAHRAVLEAHQPFREFEYGVYSDAGELYWYHINGQPIFDDSGRFVGYHGTGRNITERKRAEAEREALHRQLLDTSRLAGMAEIATGVLHNVGNVLNSVNVTVDLLGKHLSALRVPQLARALGTLRKLLAVVPVTPVAPPAQLPKLLDYLDTLSGYFHGEQQYLLREQQAVSGHVDHIKRIISRQQVYASGAGVTEPVALARLLDDALDTHLGTHPAIRTDTDYQPLPPISTDKHKLLQILVNLVRNAKDALLQQDQPPGDHRCLNVRLRRDDGQPVRIEITDNGVGIAPEQQRRIFEFGFTTKPDGHGFGLHTSANLARELGGSLHGYSNGLGQGATFILELPFTPANSHVA